MAVCVSLTDQHGDADSRRYTPRKRHPRSTTTQLCGSYTYIVARSVEQRAWVGRGRGKLQHHCSLRSQVPRMATAGATVALSTEARAPSRLMVTNERVHRLLITVVQRRLSRWCQTPRHRQARTACLGGALPRARAGVSIIVLYLYDMWRHHDVPPVQSKRASIQSRHGATAGPCGLMSV